MSVVEKVVHLLQHEDTLDYNMKINKTIRKIIPTCEVLIIINKVLLKNIIIVMYLPVKLLLLLGSDAGVHPQVEDDLDPLLDS